MVPKSAQSSPPPSRSGSIPESPDHTARTRAEQKFFVTRAGDGICFNQQEHLLSNVGRTCPQIWEASHCGNTFHGTTSHLILNLNGCQSLALKPSGAAVSGNQSSDGTRHTPFSGELQNGFMPNGVNRASVSLGPMLVAMSYAGVYIRSYSYSECLEPPIDRAPWSTSQSAANNWRNATDKSPHHRDLQQIEKDRRRNWEQATAYQQQLISRPFPVVVSVELSTLSRVVPEAPFQNISFPRSSCSSLSSHDVSLNLFEVSYQGEVSTLRALWVPKDRLDDTNQLLRQFDNGQRIRVCAFEDIFGEDKVIYATKLIKPSWPFAKVQANSPSVLPETCREHISQFPALVIHSLVGMHFAWILTALAEELSDAQGKSIFQGFTQNLPSDLQRVALAYVYFDQLKAYTQIVKNDNDFVNKIMTLSGHQQDEIRPFLLWFIRNRGVGEGSYLNWTWHDLRAVFITLTKFSRLLPWLQPVSPLADGYMDLSKELNRTTADFLEKHLWPSQGNNDDENKLFEANSKRLSKMIVGVMTKLIAKITDEGKESLDRMGQNPTAFDNLLSRFASCRDDFMSVPTWHSSKLTIGRKPVAPSNHHGLAQRGGAAKLPD